MVLKKEGENAFSAAEMMALRSDGGCTKLDGFQDVDITQDLKNIFVN